MKRSTFGCMMLVVAATAPAAQAQPQADPAGDRFAQPPETTPPAGEPALATGEPEPARSTPAPMPEPVMLPAMSRFPARSGWFLGGSLGVGVVGYSADWLFEEPGPAASFNVRFGGMLNRRFALSAELWSDGHRAGRDQELAVTQTCWAFAATYWAAPRFWLRAGLGSNTVNVLSNSGARRDFDSVAFLSGLGYEMTGNARYSIDLSAHLISAIFDYWSLLFADKVQRTGFSLNIGVNWY